jgi:site-specific recombinase XerD
MVVDIKKYREDKILNNSRILLDNRHVILKFDDEMSISGNAPNTRIGYLQSLREFAESIKTPFKDVTKDDVIKFLSNLKSNGYTLPKRRGKYNDATITLYKTRIRKFYQWLFGMKKFYYPPMCDFTVSPPKSKTKLPEDMLTEEEIKAMVEKADNSRDRAIISVFYESALRCSEFLNLTIKDVSFDEFGGKIQVRDGKTGDRVVRIVNSTPYLKQWLNEHPDPNPESFVWVNISPYTRRKRFHKVMTSGGLATLLKRFACLCEIRKKIHPHLYRHSRLTILANFLTESQLKLFAGWTASSKMCEKYVHLSGRDVDRAMLKAHGIIKEDEEKVSETFKPVVCSFCSTKNPPENRFCFNCFYPLSEKDVDDLKIVKTALGEITKILIKNPQLNPMLIKTLTEWDEKK